MAPRWNSGRKQAVGAARSSESHVCFTLDSGSVSEVYWPRVDQAALREMQFVVTDGEAWCSDEKSGTTSTLRWLDTGVPGYELENTCRSGRYVIRKTIVTDPRRHVLLVRARVTFAADLVGRQRLYVFLVPHLGNSGSENDARVGDYDGVPMLFAERPGYGLALACSAPWQQRSAGFVGVSDGFGDLRAHAKLTHEYERALGGNVALTGEIVCAPNTEFVLALGFGRTATEAGHRARASLLHGFDEALELYVAAWRGWQRSLRSFGGFGPDTESLYRASSAVIGVHESKEFPGATIASLSFPWGVLGAELDAGRDRGGYHLVWPRDACEAAGALLAAGARDELTRTLEFLAATQQADGSWPQNLWLDGKAFWTGVQLDETAAPILLVDLVRRAGRMSPRDAERLWPMLRAAAGFIARTGPLTPEDRWEDKAGLAPFSLAATIAALLVAAEIAEEHADAALGAFLRETADGWNDRIDAWLYAEHTPLACDHGVGGYYVRFAPASVLDGAPLAQAEVELPAGDGNARVAADRLVSVDALALVRFGLRRADDPRVVNTVRVIDALLRVSTPHGPCWRRYNHDRYGEHADGAPFDGDGIGRAWPLLVGERAHYELARGDDAEARRLLHVLEAFAGSTRLLPEQVWDAEPIPERRLSPGEATNSARPLVWAHAEYVKLLRSLADGVVFDRPPQTVKRYLEDGVRSSHTVWRFERRAERSECGKTLRLETFAAARVRWSEDGWRSVHDTETADLGIGLFVADLPTAGLAAGRRVVFTFFWLEAGRWEGRDFVVEIGLAAEERAPC